MSALCGIGHFEAFLCTLTALGARFFRSIAIPNRAPFAVAVIPAGQRVFMTEKDAVRLTGAPATAYALGIPLADWPNPFEGAVSC